MSRKEVFPDTEKRRRQELSTLIESAEEHILSLTNQTALKVVSREDLERAYRKVGLHKGEEIDIQATVGR